MKISKKRKSEKVKKLKNQILIGWHTSTIWFAIGWAPFAEICRGWARQGKWLAQETLNYFYILFITSICRGHSTTCCLENMWVPQDGHLFLAIEFSTRSRINSNLLFTFCVSPLSSLLLSTLLRSFVTMLNPKFISKTLPK